PAAAPAAPAPTATPAVAVAAVPVAVAVAPAATALFNVPVVRRVNVGDVQEAVPADAEVDERRLDARLDVDDTTLIDVADVTLLTRSFDVQLLEYAVLDDRDAA